MKKSESKMVDEIKNSIAIIIPAFNEELTIVDTMRDFHYYLPQAEIYVINNNSSDSTELKAKEAYREFGIRGQVINEKRQGKAEAIRTAFKEIDSEIYVMIDADSTYQGSDLNRMISSLLESKADMIVGDRHNTGAYKNQNKRRFHFFGNMLVKSIINFLFGCELNDIMSGYRIFSNRFVKTYPILCKGFELETEMTLHALDKRFVIKEEGIIYKDRPSGSFSKLSTISDGIKVLKTIIWIFKIYKPLHFFGYLSALLFILGILTGFPVINDYVTQRYVHHIPLAILSTGLVIASMISLAIGLILDTISRFHKFNYELYLIERGRFK